MGFIKRYWKWIVLVQIISLLFWGVPRLSNDWQLKHRQQTLLKAIADRNAREYRSLVSSGYADEWEFNAEKIQRAMDDVAVQFFTLQIVPEEVGWIQGDKEATWNARLVLKGKPATPIGDMIISQSEKLKIPFSFVWKKEGWGAWTWKLVAVKNDSLEVPPDYQPGMASGVGDLPTGL